MGKEQENIKQMKGWKREKLLDEYLSHIDCLESTLITNKMRRDIAKTILEYKNANLQAAFNEVLAYFTAVILLFTMVQIILSIIIYSDKIRGGLGLLLMFVIAIGFIRVILFSRKTRYELKNNE